MKYILSLLLILAPVLTFGQSAERWNIALIPASGSTFASIIPNAQISVCTWNEQLQCTSQVGIFSEPALTSPITQPLQANSAGVYDYYVQSGTHVVEQVCAPYNQCSFYDILVGDSGISGGSSTIVEVNGSDTIPVSPVNFVDSETVTWHLSGATITATTAGVGSGCGPVSGDNSSTNCGFQNRVNDTASIPATVQTFGSNLLLNNSAQEVVALGDSAGSNLTGADAVVIGDHEAPYNTISSNYDYNSLVSIGKTDVPGAIDTPCNILSGGVFIGESNNSPCAGQTLFGDVMVGLGNFQNSTNTASTGAVDNVVAIGWQNGWQGTRAGDLPRVLIHSVDAVLIGDKAGAEIQGMNDVVAIGDFPLCCSAPDEYPVSVSDIVGIGDLPFSGIQDGESVDIGIGLTPLNVRVGLDGQPAGTEQIGIGDSAGDNSLGTDVIAIGDTAVSNQFSTGSPNVNTGHDVIGIGNHALQANNTGTDNIGIGDYAGCVGCTLTNPGNGNLAGSHNVWIGDTAGPNTTTQLSNTIAIGYQAYNTVPNETVLGNPSTTLAVIYGNLEINAGTTVVYRCATSGTLPAGALTITAGSCGTTADTGLRVQ